MRLGRSIQRSFKCPGTTPLRGLGAIGPISPGLLRIRRGLTPLAAAGLREEEIADIEGKLADRCVDILVEKGVFICSAVYD